MWNISHTTTSSQNFSRWILVFTSTPSECRCWNRVLLETDTTRLALNNAMFKVSQPWNTNVQRFLFFYPHGCSHARVKISVRGLGFHLLSFPFRCCLMSSPRLHDEIHGRNPSCQVIGLLFAIVWTSNWTGESNTVAGECITSVVLSCENNLVQAFTELPFILALSLTSSALSLSTHRNSWAASYRQERVDKKIFTINDIESRLKNKTNVLLWSPGSLLY